MRSGNQGYTVLLVDEKVWQADMLGQTCSHTYDHYTVVHVLQAEHMKKLDCEMMFTVVQKNDHYCGGTEKGVNYLQKEIPWLPYSFMGSLAKPGKVSAYNVLES